MELYKETINTVEFEPPNAPLGTVQVNYELNGGSASQWSTMPSADADGLYRYTLPYLPDEGVAKVNWKFTIAGKEHIKSVSYNIVTPYLNTRWIKNNLLDFTTDEEAREAEASVRYIINAHTGQEFGRVAKKRLVYGTGGNALMLPSRLISINTVNGVSNSSLNIISDGWYLEVPRIGLPPLKADYYGTHTIKGEIYNPYGLRASYFADGARYEIDGVWGWEDVPAPITEAAKLLIGDYASQDGIYRDRYLTSMTAADWRIQFNSGAFQQTGNVRADQLLSQYVIRRGWGVI